MEAGKPKMKYGELRTEKQYLKKMTADVISRFGDSLDMIAFGWMVYALTGSASLTAVTVAVNTLVSVLLSPFSAALITGWDKKAVIVTCDIGRGVMVTLTAALYFAGILQPWMVILITGLNSTLEAFRIPAGTAVLPMILAKEKYTLGTSLSGALSRVAELAGMGMAGVLVDIIGVSGVLLIDAATFFIAAVIIAGLKLPQHVKEAAKNAFAEFLRNTREGFAYAKGNTVALAICGFACFSNFALTPLSALQTAYVNESLGLGAKALSVMGVSMTVGMGLGSIVVPRLVSRMTRFAVLFTGNLFLSLSFLSLAFFHGISGLWIWAALTAALFVFGVGIGFCNTTVQVSFIENIDREYLARMGGIMSSVCMAAMPVASLVSATLVKLVSVSSVFMIFGILAIAVSLAILFIKPLRRI